MIFHHASGQIYPIPHGVPEVFPVPFCHHDGYLAFLGRIAPEKGPDRAIAIAKKVGRKLKIAAKVDPADRAYFREIIEPMIKRSPDRVRRLLSANTRSPTFLVVLRHSSSPSIGPNRSVW